MRFAVLLSRTLLRCGVFSIWFLLIVFISCAPSVVISHRVLFSAPSQHEIVQMQGKGFFAGERGGNVNSGSATGDRLFSQIGRFVKTA